MFGVEDVMCFELFDVVGYGVVCFVIVVHYDVRDCAIIRVMWSDTKSASSAEFDYLSLHRVHKKCKSFK